MFGEMNSTETTRKKNIITNINSLRNSHKNLTKSKRRNKTEKTLVKHDTNTQANTGDVSFKDSQQ